ncbi:MAG: extracellular solute-binding protein [Patescibacteria group bacterium]
MNITKILIIGAVAFTLIFIFLIYLGVIPGLKIGAEQKSVALDVWGVFDDSDAMLPLIQTFQLNNPGVTINYRKKSIQNYEEELVRAFAAGKGPDIFMISNTWAPKFRDLLMPAPSDLISINDFQKRFVDVVQRDFTYQGNIYGIPLYVDSLALYYNIDLFNSAGLIDPPKDWDEFEKYAKLLTKRDSKGDILVSGAALGSGKNVLNSADILSLLMIQNGSNISDPQKGEIIFDKEQAVGSSKALKFYTQFAKPEDPSYSWSQNFKADSQEMFALGRVAMLFGYSWTKNSIIQKAPRLRFTSAYMPQIKDSIVKKNYANYWGYGIYAKSSDAVVAWKFLKFLSDPKNAGFYLSQVKYPASQRSILTIQKDDSNLLIFANQALSATSWLQINDTLVKNVFIDMLDQHVASEQAESLALRKAAAEINSKILSK